MGKACGRHRPAAEAVRADVGAQRRCGRRAKRTTGTRGPLVEPRPKAVAFRPEHPQALLLVCSSAVELTVPQGRPVAFLGGSLGTPSPVGTLGVSEAAAIEAPGRKAGQVLPPSVGQELLALSLCRLLASEAPELVAMFRGLSL